MTDSLLAGGATDERTLGQRAAAVLSLPSQTALRFVVLVVAVLVCSVYVYDALYFTVHLEQERALLARCTQVGLDAVDAVAAQAAQTACRAPAHRDRVVWTVLFAPLTVLVGLGVAGTAPWLRRRRHGLVPLPAAARHARERTENAARLLGLRRTPVLTWQPRRVSGAATAYGLPWRPQVELAPGTVVLAAVDPHRFDAVLRHELAHVRNRDILLGGAAAGSLLAFVLVAGVPFSLSLLLPGLPLTTDAFALLQIVVLTGLLLLAQRDVLRAREHEADLRALSVGAAPAGDLLPARPAGLWPRLFGTHPDSAARTRVLQRPETLLRVSPGQAAASGFLAFLPVPVASQLVGGWAVGSGAGPTGAFLATAALAVPFGAWAGAVAVRLAHDVHERRSGAATGLAASVGATVALALFDRGLYQPIELLPRQGTHALLLLLLVLVSTGLFVWLGDVARRCSMRGWSIRRTAVAVSALGAVSGGVVVAYVARVWQVAVATDQGQAFAKDPALALGEIVFGTSSAGVGSAMTAVLVSPVVLALPRAGQRRAGVGRAAVVLIAIAVGAAGGWAALRISDARLRSVTTAEVREQVIVQSRHVLVNQTVGLATAAILAAVLLALMGRRLHVVVASAVLASWGVALVQVATAAGLSLFTAADLTLSAAVLSSLIALAAGAGLGAVRRTAWSPGRGARLALAVGALASPVAIAGAASHYIAAPQQALREAPAFAAWMESTGAGGLAVLDGCAELAAPAPQTLDRAALTVVDDARRSIRAPTWQSEEFREVQRRLAAALQECRAGVEASLAGDPEPIAFRRSLCGYQGALSYAEGIGGVSTPLDVGVLQVCGGRPSVTSVPS